MGSGRGGGEGGEWEATLQIERTVFIQTVRQHNPRSLLPLVTRHAPSYRLLNLACPVLCCTYRETDYNKRGKEGVDKKNHSYLPSVTGTTRAHYDCPQESPVCWLKAWRADRLGKGRTRLSCQMMVCYLFQMCLSSSIIPSTRNKHGPCVTSVLNITLGSNRRKNTRIYTNVDYKVCVWIEKGRST